MKQNTEMISLPTSQDFKVWGGGGWKAGHTFPMAGIAHRCQ